MRRHFEFRMQRVARVRDIEERLAREERAAAETRARAAEDERERVRRQLAEARRQLTEHITHSVDAGRVLSAHRLIDDHQRLLRERVGQAAQQRRAADAAAEVHRLRRSAAMAMEKLRERARTRHLEALNKEENAQMDEVASQRARRPSGSTTPLAARPDPLAGWKRETASRIVAAPADQDPIASSERAP